MNELTIDNWVFIASLPRTGSTFCTWMLQHEDIYLTNEQNWLLSIYDISFVWMKKRVAGAEPNDIRVFHDNTPYQLSWLNNAFIKNPEAFTYSLALGMRTLYGSPIWFGDKYPWYAVVRNWQNLRRILIDGAYYLGRRAKVKFIVCIRDYQETLESFHLLLKNQDVKVDGHEEHLQRAYYGVHELLKLHPDDTFYFDYDELKSDWRDVGNRIRNWLDLPLISFPEPPGWAYSMNSERKSKIVACSETSDSSPNSNTDSNSRMSGTINETHSTIKKNVDIALTICPPWDIVTPPLGLAYITTYLKCMGLHPEVIDLNILLYHEMEERLRDILWKFDSFTLWEQQGCRIMGNDFKKYMNFCVDMLLSVDTDVFGFSLYHANVGMSVEIARGVKEARPDATIVFGGPSCGDPFDRADIPQGLVNYIVNGEGEQVLAEFLFCLKSGQDITGITGLSKAEVPLGNTHKSLLSNIDSIPFPNYIEFSLEKYTGRGQLRVIASRGCVARCRFCNESYYTGKFRNRSAEKVFAELMYHKERHGIKAFIFSDQEINGNLRELESLCDLILKENVEIFWSGQAIARKDMPLSLFQKVKASGCYGLDFGIESGSSTVLKRMTKPFTAVGAEVVLAHCHEAGIVTGINIIVGFPGENEQEFTETMEFLKRNRASINKISNISTCFIKPFSDFYFNPENYGIRIPDKAYFWYNWEDINIKENRNNERRIEKLNRLVSFCRKWKIPVENTYSFS